MHIKPNNILKISQIAIFFALSVLAAGYTAAYSKVKANKQNNFEKAAAYSKSTRGLSLLVLKDGKIVFEQYHNGHSADKAHMLASGTKSFSGILLAAAIEDGLISGFDEKVSDTITEWKTYKLKSQITLRQLLSLTSGIDVGNNGRPPAYSEAINFSMKYEPGTIFQYGPAPFQIFGEVMRRKLMHRNKTVMDYLQKRILDPIGLKVSKWNFKEGQPNLPSGAFLTAREWAKFGKLLINEGKLDGKTIITKSHLKELTHGSKANPNYGLTFWLNRSSQHEAKLAEDENSGRRKFLRRRILNIRSETDEISMEGIGENLPKDIFIAAGAGNQRLYIIPTENMVVVRQGRFSQFDDKKFLSLLLNVRDGITK